MRQSSYIVQLRIRKRVGISISNDEPVVVPAVGNKMLLKSLAFRCMFALLSLESVTGVGVTGSVVDVADVGAVAEKRTGHEKTLPSKPVNKPDGG